MKQTEQVAEMRGTMNQFINFELAAKQRLEIRVETEGMIEKADAFAARAEASDRAAAISQVLQDARAYADARDERLEKRLLDQEERDKKREGDIRLQFIGVAVMAFAGLAYAIYSILVRGAI